MFGCLLLLHTFLDLRVPLGITKCNAWLAFDIFGLTSFSVSLLVVILDRPHPPLLLLLASIMFIRWNCFGPNLQSDLYGFSCHVVDPAMRVWISV